MTPDQKKTQRLFLERLARAGYVRQFYLSDQDCAIALTERGTALVRSLLELERDLDGIGQEEAVHLVALIYFFKGRFPAD